MLWNAKMRFGKTLSALEVAKRAGYKKTLIFTHRPVVSDGWFDDFKKIFNDTNYKFGSKTMGENIENLIDTDEPFVYFASIQDLRGSQVVGGKFDKNEYIFLIYACRFVLYFGGKLFANDFPRTNACKYQW